MRHTEATKQKLSEMRRGRNPFYGKKHSPEFRVRLSERTKAFNAKRQYAVQPQKITAPTGTTAAYIAGMVDADGSIRTRGGRPFVAIYNTHRPLIEWVMATLGHGCVTKGPMGRERVEAWTVSAAQDVWALIHAIYPFLIVKKGDADAVLKILSEKYKWPLELQ